MADSVRKQEEVLCKHCLDLKRAAEKRYMDTFSEFLTLYEQETVMSYLSRFTDVDSDCPSEVLFDGGYESAERKIIHFHPVGVGCNDPAPICALLIKPKMAKFADASLSHRDFLGSVLGLGIERAYIGDILIHPEGTEANECILICHEKVVDFIKENLTSVRHTSVIVSDYSVYNEQRMMFEIPNVVPRMKEVTATVAGIRLDAIICAAFHLPRSQGSELSGDGELVSVNGKMVNSGKMEVKPGSVISVRGHGKFIYDGDTGVSGKNRYWIHLRIYQ